jgi:integrative and conjugative element protein (TIGR02256 family)
MNAATAGILVTSMALRGADDAARAALPDETGGILLGFHTPDLIVVTRILLVPDPHSSRHSYLRHRLRAQAQMAANHTDLPSIVGYVGEWHTHPADLGPSRTDARTLGATARLAASPVALIVLAYPPTGQARTHGMVALKHASWPTATIGRIDVITSQISITNDTAASLEAEATALTEMRSQLEQQ